MERWLHSCIISVVILLVSACSQEDEALTDPSSTVPSGTSESTSSANRVVSGQANKGVISGGQVLLQGRDAQGELFTLAQATTDDTGRYQVTVDDSYTGPILLTVTPANNALITCDAPSGCGQVDPEFTDLDLNQNGTVDFAERFPVPDDFILQAVSEVDTSGEQVDLHATALTHMAASLAQEQGLDNDTVEAANNRVAQLFNVAGDIATIEPVDVTRLDALQQGDEVQIAYSTAAASVMELADPDNGLPIDDVLDQLADNFSDDGQLLVNDGGADTEISVAELADVGVRLSNHLMEQAEPVSAEVATVLDNISLDLQTRATVAAQEPAGQVTEVTTEVPLVVTAQAVSGSAQRVNGRVQVLSGESVNLNASVSGAGSNFQVQWQQVSGPDVSIENDNSAQARFIAAAQPGQSVTLAFRVVANSNAAANNGRSRAAVLENGRSASDVLQVTVVNPNTRPVAVSDQALLAEDESVLINVLANDQDAESDPLLVVSVSTADNGEVSIEDGQIRYQPNPDFNGDDNFAYEVSDGQLQAAGLVTVTVTPVNDAPRTEDDTVELAEDTSVVINLLANDLDVEGSALDLVSLSTPEHGEAVQGADGRVEYTPNANFFGTDHFTYQVTDGEAVAAGMVTIDVTPVNDAPFAQADTAEVNEDSSVLINALANDLDVEGDSLRLVNVIGTSQGQARIEAGQIRYTPADNFFGADVISYTMSDGVLESSAQVTVSVLPVNDAPVVANDTSALDEDTTVVIDVLANDTDIDSSNLSISSVSQAAHGELVIESGRVRYTPELNFNGSDSFSYQVTDGEAQVTGQVSLTIRPVNDQPQAVVDTGSLDEDRSLTVSVLNNDVDVDGDSLSLVAVSDATNGSVSISGRDIRYRPVADFNGTDSFTYTISDGELTSTAEVQLVILPVNDPPVSASDTFTIPPGVTTSVNPLANDIDIDGDNLLLTNVSAFGPVQGSFAVVDNRLEITPNEELSTGEAIGFLIYTLSDGTATRTSTINVLAGEPLILPEAEVEFTVTQLPLPPFEDPTGGLGSILFPFLPSFHNADGTFTLPDDTVSFALHLSGAAAGLDSSPVLFTIVTNPLGENVPIDTGSNQSCTFQLCSFLHPRNPDEGVIPGEWSYRVRFTNLIGGIIDLSTGTSVVDGPNAQDIGLFLVVRRRAEPLPEATSFNIQPWLTGNPNNDAQIQAVLGRARTILEGNNIQLNISPTEEIEGINFAQLPGNFEATVVRSLVRQGIGGALNVFFAESLTGDEDVVIGGTPGPLGIENQNNGILLGLDNFLDETGQLDVDYAAETLIHNIGLFLGLAESSSASGTSHDNLDDTAECVAEERDLDADGQVSADECLGFGAENIMFWQRSRTLDQLQFSPSQLQFLRRSPLAIVP